MLRKIILALVLAAAAVLASSRLFDWPVRFGPLRAPGSVDVSRPSGDAPDNIVLVPAGDMADSISVTWRSSAKIADGVVQYRKRDDDQGKTTEVPALLTALTSPELKSDNTVHCFSAALAGLAPGTTYSYRVGSGEQNIWSDEAEFTTAEAAPESFSFVYMGDTQASAAQAGVFLNAIEERHPGTAFYMNSGDIIDAGELRNQWDDFLAGDHGVFARKAFVPAVGNHDPGDGNQGLATFNAYFNTPGRDPKKPKQVENYSFRLGAGYFIVINSEDVSDQTEWLENELRTADKLGARFRIVMFHHPVYDPKEHRSYEVAEEEWVPLFDRYGVDLVLTGHDHSYARSKPLRAGKPVPGGGFGTTYVVSTACNKFYDVEKLDTAEIQLGDVATYQLITLSVGDAGEAEVQYRACSSDNAIVDEFAYTKP